MHADSPGPLLALVPAFWSAYAAELGPNATDAYEQRTARLLLCLMLARVHGKSPVEYLTRPEHRRFVTDFVVSRLSGPRCDLQALTAAWTSGLRTL